MLAYQGCLALWLVWWDEACVGVGHDALGLMSIMNLSETTLSQLIFFLRELVSALYSS